MNDVRAVLVASAGGHIDELATLIGRVPAIADKVWITSRNAQTTSLLRGQVVCWVPPVASRQYIRAFRGVSAAAALLRQQQPDVVISTGAALAAPVMVAASALRIPVIFIESATRVHGPSVTGRLARMLPGARTMHQAFLKPQSSWMHVGNVFDGFRPTERHSQAEVRSLVVVLGSERFPFPRALQQIRGGLPDGAEILWQIGSTLPPTPSERRGTYRDWVDFDELTAAVVKADVVVTHCGVGSVLTALRAGHHPLVIPRRRRSGEHIDDHQSQLAHSLQQQGLVTVLEDADDVQTVLLACANRSTSMRTDMPLTLPWE